MMPVILFMKLLMNKRRGGKVKASEEKTKLTIKIPRYKHLPEKTDEKSKLTIRIPPQTVENCGQEQLIIKTPTKNPQPTAEYSAADTNLANNGDQVQSLLNVMAGEGLDLPKILQGHYNEDSFFKVILENPKHYKNFVEENRLMYLKLNDRNLLCIPTLYVQGRNICEIVISEAHSLLAHLGASKTIAYLQDNMWWKDMTTDTTSYCLSCMTCKRSKPTTQKPYGLLNPLDVSTYPWESIGVDFVGPLPESKNQDGTFNSITVVICLLTSLVHLIPS